mmetsp:Transcript_42079/g.116238  ORF Transcript_42079/g.116238 Transcript_42079/m.116238 type:complete len:204 (+) Transcript_42079:213-824(+)
MTRQPPEGGSLKAGSIQRGPGRMLSISPRRQHLRANCGCSPPSIPHCDTALGARSRPLGASAPRRPSSVVRAPRRRSKARGKSTPVTSSSAKSRRASAPPPRRPAARMPTLPRDVPGPHPRSGTRAPPRAGTRRDWKAGLSRRPAVCQAAAATPRSGRPRPAHDAPPAACGYKPPARRAPGRQAHRPPFGAAATAICRPRLQR